MIRLFDWRDLPILHRYRNQGLFLDSTLFVTRGPTIFSGVLLSFLTPALGVFTSVCSEDEDPEHVLIGQVIHTAESPLAQLSFLAPEEKLENPGILRLIEHLVRLVGERGALHIRAEVDVRSIAFEALRQVGFAIYARQRIWRLGDKMVNQKPALPWEVAEERDALAVQTLYNSLVPGLVQQVESPSADNQPGLICRHREELLGYVALKYGPRGIWAQPFIHPDTSDIHSRLRDMILSIPERRGRPIYLCARSYQSWLESAMHNLDTETGPQQAVMIKHLAMRQKVTRPLTLRQLEGQPEASAPIAQSKRNS